MDHLRRPRRQDQEDGAISVMAAVMTLAVLLASALAVDVGRVASVSRDQQGVTDRAALSAIQVLETVPAGTNITGLQPLVEDAVDKSVRRNPGSQSTTVDGEYQVTMIELGNVGTDRRFTVPSSCVDVSAPDYPCTVEDISAVRVQTTSEVPFIFGIGATDDEDPDLNARRVTKSAVAEQTEVASLTVGSRLASLRDGLVNDTLDAMVCQNVGADDCDVSVDVATYEGLFGTTVRLGDLVDELGISVGSVDDILMARVSAMDLVRATAAVLGRDGSVAEADLLNAVAAEMDGSIQVLLGDAEDELGLLEIASTNGRAVLDSDVNVFSLLNGSLQLANGTNLIALPNVGATVPELASQDVSITAIEGPVTAIGEARQDPDGSWATSAETSQVDLESSSVIEASTLSGVVSSVAGLVPALELGEPTISDLSLPLEMEVAEGKADLTDIACQPGGPGSLPNVTSEVTTGAVQVTIPDDQVVSIDIPVEVEGSVLGLGLSLVDAGTLEIRVEGTATPVGLGSTSPEPVDFDAGTYPRGPQSVGGSDTGLGGLMQTHLQFDVTVDHNHGDSILSAAVSVVTDALTASVQASIADAVESSVQSAVFPTVDTLNNEVLDPVLKTLGVEVGAADVWANSADCEERALAAIVE